MLQSRPTVGCIAVLTVGSRNGQQEASLPGLANETGKVCHNPRVHKDHFRVAAQGATFGNHNPLFPSSPLSPLLLGSSRRVPRQQEKWNCHTVVACDSDSLVLRQGHTGLLELMEMSWAEQQAAILTNGRVYFWERSRY